MRIIVIFNPWANRGGANRQREQVEALCQKHQFTLVFTEKTNDAKTLAHQAARENYDVVVAAGGDGTVHEVVNGLCQYQGLRPRLGILPIGSGNDLAFSLGIPKGLADAAQQIRHGTPQIIDLAKIEAENGRFALADNNIGIGFDAQVVIQTEAIQWSGGFFLYLYATFQTLYNHFNMLSLNIQFDKERIQQSALFVAFGLGIRGGGGFLFTPAAKHDDNLIDSCFVRPMSRLKALMLLPSAINGKHTQSSYITMRQNQQIIVEAAHPMPIHVDGEIFAYPKDNVKKVTITSLPSAIEVMV